MINTTNSQDINTSSLKIGDSAPTLYIGEWLKGEPILKLEKGHVYVIEFWATWCKPCISAIPHLSNIASEHKDKLSIIAVNIYEDKNTTRKQVVDFVNKMGDKMNYHVALDNGDKMVKEWIHAFYNHKGGIPKAFVVNAEGRLAWVGHPSRLNPVLAKIFANDWDLDKALKSESDRRGFRKLEKAANLNILDIVEKNKKINFIQREYTILEQADSILYTINNILGENPVLKYSPIITSYTFSALLGVTQDEASAYAKSILTPNVNNLQVQAIVDIVRNYADKINLNPEIYRIGAEAYQLKIDRVIYPENENISQYYSDTAYWYWRALDSEKAIAIQKKAIEQLKKQEGFLQTDLAALEMKLEQYSILGQ